MEDFAKAIASCSSTLPGKTFIPGDESSYVSSFFPYFSAQGAELKPGCILTPTDSSDVCRIIKILYKYRVKFAICAGGFSLNPETSNVDKGIVINLRALNSVQVSQDGTAVMVGGGAKWKEVYYHLDPLGLAISGGRIADAGVGGLATGGGISFFSAREGLVCDNIISYKVVLSSGEIVNVDEAENDHLWHALKGGSNNFGVVTSFTFRCFPQLPYYGGCIASQISTLSIQLEGLMSLLDNYDPAAGIVISIRFSQRQDALSILTRLHHTQQSPATWMKSFLEMPTKFMNTMRVSTTGDFAQENMNYVEAGLRSQFATTTFRAPDIQFLRAVYQIFENSIPSISHIRGVNWEMNIQPLNLPPMTNSFSELQTPAVLFHLSYNWTRKKDDKTIEKAAKALIAEVDAASQEMGCAVEFRYLNYAAPWQDPISSYGERKVGLMTTVGKEYDPEGMFQKQCSGYFKITRH